MSPTACRTPCQTWLEPLHIEPDHVSPALDVPFAPQRAGHPALELTPAAPYGGCGSGGRWATAGADPHKRRDA
jgi:hypothetical protein